MPTLLLADENVTTQRVIALTFADQSFQVVTVGSSQQIGRASCRERVYLCV